MMSAHKQQVTIVRKSESSERMKMEEIRSKEDKKMTQLTFEEMESEEEEKLNWTIKKLLTNFSKFISQIYRILHNFVNTNDDASRV
jgi:hypothetical protein